MSIATGTNKETGEVVELTSEYFAGKWTYGFESTRKPYEIYSKSMDKTVLVSDPEQKSKLDNWIRENVDRS